MRHKYHHLVSTVYSTFLEMCEEEPDDLLSNMGQEMPSVKDKQLGRCEICPAYTFLSVTEMKRHMSIFHPNKSARTPQGHPSSFFASTRLRQIRSVGYHFSQCTGSIYTRRGLAIARENVERRPQVLQKSPAPKAFWRST